MTTTHSYRLFRRTVALAALTGLVCIAGCASYSKKTDSFVKLYESGQFAEAAVVADQTVGAIPNPNKQAVPDPDDLRKPKPVVDRNAPASTTPPVAVADASFKVPDAVELDKCLKVDARDAVIFRLDQAQVLRTAGRLQESRIALYHTGEMFDRYDEKPEVQISKEVGAAVTNLTALDYRGYAYDRLAMETYRALIDMQLGDLDDARIAFHALQQRQDEAEEHFRKRIEAAEGKGGEKQVPAQTQGSGESNAANSNESVDVDRARKDPKFTQDLNAAYGEDVPSVPDRAAYKNYFNPFGEYLMGIYFMTAGVNASDAETAVTALKRVRGMFPTNTFVAQDLAMAESVANGKPVPPTTYVLFETGLGPTRTEVRVAVPVFLAGGQVGNASYVGAAFPKLLFRGNFVPNLDIQAGDQNYQTAVMTDMDQVVKKDFQNELPLVITRTLIATATKAAASYGINKGTESNGYAHLASLIGTAVYQHAMNHADLRTWETLPKQFQVARFPTPANRQIVITLANGPTLPPITLATDGVVNVVYVKSVQAGTAPVITQFKLK